MDRIGDWRFRPVVLLRTTFTGEAETHAPQFEWRLGAGSHIHAKSGKRSACHREGHRGFTCAY
jgi:hypothetical protein